MIKKPIKSVIDLECLAKLPLKLITRGSIFICAVNLLELADSNYVAEDASILADEISIDKDSLINFSIDEKDINQFIRNVQWLGDNHQIISNIGDNKTINHYLFEFFWTLMPILSKYNEPEVERKRIILKNISPELAKEYGSEVEMPKRLVNDARFLADVICWGLSQEENRLVVCSNKATLGQMLKAGLDNLVSLNRFGLVNQKLYKELQKLYTKIVPLDQFKEVMLDPSDSGASLFLS